MTIPLRDCLLVKPDCQIAPAAQPFVVFRPVANVVLLLLRVLVLAALGILHARTYLGHHHRRISLSARAVQQRLFAATSALNEGRGINPGDTTTTERGLLNISERSTKAGASTPATPISVCKYVEYNDGAQRKAGASTPATPVQQERLIGR